MNIEKSWKCWQESDKYYDAKNIDLLIMGKIVDLFPFFTSKINLKIQHVL